MEGGREMRYIIIIREREREVNWSVCSRSPGFGLTLVAESNTGVMHAAESSTYSQTTPTSTTSTQLPGSAPEGKGGRGSEGPVLPEDIGKNTASLLLAEITKVC